MKYGDGKKVKVRTRATRGRLMLSVHNEGNPIPEDQHNRIFDYLRREGDSTAVPGWGMVDNSSRLLRKATEPAWPRIAHPRWKSLSSLTCLSIAALLLHRREQWKCVAGMRNCWWMQLVIPLCPHAHVRYQLSVNVQHCHGKKSRLGILNAVLVSHQDSRALTTSRWPVADTVRRGRGDIQTGGRENNVFSSSLSHSHIEPSVIEH
ncbi:hypothetical protein [Pseudoduganella umbonata]|uniref:hypothetical protein n=1 Tax=Pseudoduganella umbonata TaxID=864828 RepID=UPI003530E7D3